MTRTAEGAAVRRTVAVIGAGVSGLTAAYLLQRTSDVTLYEADDRLGGHAHTHDVLAGHRSIPVDSGFIVHNPRTYPLLTRLLRELGVHTRPTEMSMSVRCEGCGLLYAGARGVTGLLARPGNALRPRYAAMLTQIPRFYQDARALLSRGEPTPDATEPTLGEFLHSGGFSPYFVGHFAVPLVSAVWSCGPQAALDYPARYLFTFLHQHNMLSLSRSAAWRTVEGGSRRYVEAAAKELSAVRISTPVRAIHRSAGSATIRDDSDATARFDAVVIATHADQALRLLAEPSDAERDVLGSFEYSRNQTVLHSDGSVLPDRAAAQASWNYVLPGCAPDAGPVQVSYDLNRLQGLRSSIPIVVTLNSGERIRPDRVLATMVYEHPVYTRAVLAAQRRLPTLNDAVTAFAGAYQGWGFHEDGCRSGVEAARSLGARW